MTDEPKIVPSAMLGAPLNRILVVNPLWPHSAHSTRAANVVIYELIAELARQPGLEVGFLKLDASESQAQTEAERASIRELSSLGVTVLNPFVCPTREVAKPSRLRFWLFPKEVYFYPEATQRSAACGTAMAFRPEMLFVPWSEMATSLFADVPVPKFAYYGNPDTKSGLARADFARANGGALVEYIARRLSLARQERFHLATMKKYDYLGDVAANDAEYYRRKGHQNSFYVRNVWIDRFGLSWRDRRDRERIDPFVIVGNVGKLDATANTQGMEILGRDVVPELQRVMGNRKFEVHICGAGRLNPKVAAHLQAPEIKMRGFVDDIDEELLTAPVFLCVNNGSRFKVGHTRYLHAWSLGSCVVAHKDVALSMPEMVSGENCLLGGSVAEIAEMTRAVADDPVLRRRIGEAGYGTFVRKFTASSVVEQILKRLNTPLRIP
jgi:hypothetical protein